MSKRRHPEHDEMSPETDRADAAGDYRRQEDFAGDSRRENTGAVNAAAEVDELRRRVHDAEKRALMYQADLENFRQRKNRETADMIRYACLPLVENLLGVLDNLERALEAARSEQGSIESLSAGVEMVTGQLRGILEQHGCFRLEATGQPFDPNYHEAIQTRPGGEPNTVLEEVQPGYRLHDRVVRPARVVVSTGRESGSKDS